MQGRQRHRAVLSDQPAAGPVQAHGGSGGFKKWSATLTLQVGETAVIDIPLEVGAVEAVVEVSGVAPIITTEGSAISDVKDALRIRQLPLNGRSIVNLFNLTPGVEGGGIRASTG